MLNRNIESRLMTGGEAIVSQLAVNGVDTVFGIPGAQTYPIWDALDRTGTKIRTIGTRHEQAAAYMAFGYAKSTGRPGVYSVVPGPGVLNTTAALCTAMGANTPVLCVTGQIPRDALGQGRGALHELRDQLETLQTLSKWSVRIDRASDAPEIINEAFRVMLSGRPGPVTVEMCWDDMANSEMVSPLPPADIDAPPALDKKQLAAAAKMIAGAKRPLIFAGGGAQHAVAEIHELAELLQAPVTSFRSGRGIVSEDHPLGLSSLAAYDYHKQCDVLIAIGSRCEPVYTRWNTNILSVQAEPLAPPYLVRIDIDPDEMKRLVPHAGLLADSAVGTKALTEALRGKREPSPDALADIANSRDWAAPRAQEIQPHAGYLAAIRDALPRDGYFVEEICQAGFTALYAYPVYEPRTFVTCGFQGTLGFGFPSALGVKIAHPDKAVVSITGDGGFMFGMQELATARQHNIGLITVVYNNGVFANVRRDQRRIYKGRSVAAEFENPPFKELAETFGIDGYRVDQPDDLKAALKQAIAKDEPALIEVMIDPATEKSPWKYIMMHY